MVPALTATLKTKTFAFKNIMTRTRFERVWNVRIINELLYRGHDLKGFDFDFLDIKYGILALGEHEKQRKREIYAPNQRKKDKLMVDNNGEYRAMHF